MTFTELKSEVRRVGGLGDTTDDLASGVAWAQAGLRKICVNGAWPWLRQAWTLALTADTYAYALTALTGGTYERIDSETIRYGRTFLTWASPAAIDDALEPSWKDAGTASGTPEYVTRVGLQLWIAGKPSATFVAANPLLYGYGFLRENYAEDATINGGSLLLPDQFMEAAVCAALAYGWHEEDDQRADNMEARFRQVWIPEMRGFDQDVGSNSRLLMPRFVYDRDQAADYGDA